MRNQNRLESFVMKSTSTHNFQKVTLNIMIVIENTQAMFLHLDLSLNIKTSSYNNQKLITMNLQELSAESKQLTSSLFYLTDLLLPQLQWFLCYLLCANQGKIDINHSLMAMCALQKSQIEFFEHVNQYYTPQMCFTTHLWCIILIRIKKAKWSQISLISTFFMSGIFLASDREKEMRNQNRNLEII